MPFVPWILYDIFSKPFRVGKVFQSEIIASVFSLVGEKNFRFHLQSPRPYESLGCHGVSKATWFFEMDLLGMFKSTGSSAFP